METSSIPYASFSVHARCKHSQHLAKTYQKHKVCSASNGSCRILQNMRHIGELALPGQSVYASYPLLQFLKRPLCLASTTPKALLILNRNRYAASSSWSLSKRASNCSWTSQIHHMYKAPQEKHKLRKWFTWLGFFWALNSKCFVRILIQNCPSECRGAANICTPSPSSDSRRELFRISLRRKSYSYQFDSVRIILVISCLSLSFYLLQGDAKRRSRLAVHRSQGISDVLLFSLHFGDKFAMEWRGSSFHSQETKALLSSCATDAMLTISSHLQAFKANWIPWLDASCRLESLEEVF